MDNKKDKSVKLVSSDDRLNHWECFGTTFSVEKNYKVIEPGKKASNV